MFRGNLAHTGAYDAAGVPKLSGLKWKFHAGGLVNAAVVLGLLYFGREVLVPITLAVILSLLIAPLVRKLRRVVR